MADDEARDMADQPTVSGDDEARELHDLDSEHCFDSDRSINDYFQPVNNLTALTDRLNEAYCELESLIDANAQIKQQLEQKSFELTELQKSHLQLLYYHQPSARRHSQFPR